MGKRRSMVRSVVTGMRNGVPGRCGGTDAVFQLSKFLTPTPAVVALQRATGSSLVGWGSASCFGSGIVGHGLGIPPNANVVFGLHELAVYDPITPEEYTTSWLQATGQPVSYAETIGFDSWYCPAVTTATTARLYGVGYVLEPLGVPGPIGAVFDQQVGNGEFIPSSRSRSCHIDSHGFIGIVPTNRSKG